MLTSFNFCVKIPVRNYLKEKRKLDAWVLDFKVKRVLHKVQCLARTEDLENEDVYNDRTYTIYENKY